MTWHHASAFPLEIGQLWLNVAANKRNVIPILDFVITQGLQEAAELPSEVSSTACKLGALPCFMQDRAFVLGRCGEAKLMPSSGVRSI